MVWKSDCSESSWTLSQTYEKSRIIRSASIRDLTAEIKVKTPQVNSYDKVPNGHDKLVTSELKVKLVDKIKVELLSKVYFYHETFEDQSQFVGAWVKFGADLVLWYCLLQFMTVIRI